MVVPRLPSRVSRVGNYLAMGAAVVACLLTSGVILGWNGLILLLDDENLYREKCEGDDANCDTRVVRMNVIFTSGATALNFSPVLFGPVLDLIGPKLTCMISGTVLALGSVLFGVSDSSSFDAFAVGFALLGLGGPGVMISSLPIADRFPRFRVPLTSILTAGLGSSSAVFIAFNYLHVWAGMTRRALFLGILAPICVAVVLHALLLWPRRSVVKSQEQRSVRAKREGLHDGLAVEGCISCGADTFDTDSNDFCHCLRDFEAVRKAEDGDVAVGDEDGDEEEFGMASAASDAARIRLVVGPVERETVVEDRAIRDPRALREESFLVQLTSLPHLLLVLFVAVVSLRLNFFLGTIADRLRWWERPREVAYHLTLYGILMPFAIFVGVPVGWLLKFGVHVGFLANCICVTMLCLTCLIPAQRFQILGFPLFFLSANTLWPSYFASLESLFGYRFIGKLTGFQAGFTSVVGMLQFLLVLVVVRWFHRSLFAADLSFFVLCLPMWLFPGMLFRLRTLRK